MLEKRNPKGRGSSKVGPDARLNKLSREPNRQADICLETWQAGGHAMEKLQRDALEP